MDHAVCLLACGVDVGALTVYWHFFQNRELIYDLLEKYCGARMLVNITASGA